MQVLTALAKDLQNQQTIDHVVALKGPNEIMAFFTKADVEIPDYLQAKDVMVIDPLTLLESDTLHATIETFARKKVHEIPVLDNDGDLRGVVSLNDILKFSLTEHILWMNDLTPIGPFSAFCRNAEIRPGNQTR